MESAIRLLVRKCRNDSAVSVGEWIRDQPDMEIVGEVTGHVELLVAVRETQANVVIAGIDPGRDEGMLTHLFAEYPDLTVLVIRPSGTVCIEQRCRCRVEIDDLSPARLAEMLRSAIRHSR